MESLSLINDILKTLETHYFIIRELQRTNSFCLLLIWDLYRNEIQSYDILYKILNCVESSNYINEQGETMTDIESRV